MKYKLQPWDHQLKAIGMARGQSCFALFFDMGTGKTGTVINMLREKYYQNKGMLKTLILCPPIVIDNWKREFGIHSFVDDKEIVCLIGSGAKRMSEFNHTRASIYITNYEVLSIKSLLPLLEALIKWGPEVLVLDESHKVKDIKSKRTKKAIGLSDIAHYKYILTGTPILNSLMDIFTQVRILDGGAMFGKNFFSFRARFFYDKNAGMSRDKYFPNWIPRPGASDEIKRLLAPISMHVAKEDCLDLPPFMRETIYVDMGKEQAKLYAEMKRDFIAFVEDKGASIAELAITKALRLQQIVSGFLPIEAGGGTRKNHKIKDNPRAMALKELLENLTPSHKVLVWCVFKENYATVREVCESLKISYVEVHGAVNTSEKHANVDKFNNESKYRVLIGHPGSGGIGINLVSASYSIFYSRSFSLEFDMQAEARNYRGGSEIHAKVTRVDLVCKDTIDEIVGKSLASKQEIGYQVLKENLRRL